MAGGTYHDHSDMETLLGMTLTATSEPITDAGMDAITVLVEGYVDALIRGRTGRTLANANAASATATTAALMELSRKYYVAQQAARAGVQTRSSSDGSTGWSAAISWQPELAVLEGLAASGQAPYRVKTTVDVNKLSGG